LRRLWLDPLPLSVSIARLRGWTRSPVSYQKSWIAILGALARPCSSKGLHAADTNKAEEMFPRARPGGQGRGDWGRDVRCR
jgi:hypothetical protein